MIKVLAEAVRKILREKRITVAIPAITTRIPVFLLASGIAAEGLMADARPTVHITVNVDRLAIQTYR